MFIYFLCIPTMNVIYLLFANPYTNMVTNGLSPGEYADQRAKAQI
jgi:hypothetical protein